MNEIDDQLEQIRVAELQKPENQYISFGSIFLGQSYIALNSEFNNSTKTISDIAYKSFRPSFSLRFFLGIVVIFFFSLFTVIAEGNSGFGMAIGFLIFILIIGRLWYILFDKRRNYNILINKENITIGKSEYKWTDIKATAILYLPIRKGGVDFLIILFNDNTYKKFDLSNFISFEGFKKTISRYIEYFKPYKVF